MQERHFHNLPYILLKTKNTTSWAVGLKKLAGPEYSPKIGTTPI